MLLIVGTGVFETETLRQIVVHLNGAELPAAAYGILDHEVEFRTVECSLTLHLTGFEALFGTCLDDGALGEMPVLVASDIFLLVPGVAQGYLRLEILEIESLEDVEDNIHHLEEFSLDLLRGAEEMGIVLRESADTGQAVEGSSWA